MLLEMANGQFAYKIPLDGNNKQFDEIAALLNEVAEKIRQANYPNPYEESSNQTLSGIDSGSLIIQKVQEYIVSHLEEALPSSKELAIMFGTNEFTLKDNFRKTFQTSIYQFYNDERLKKAHFLIQKTLIPLKEIAFLCGFNDYTNFFKAFRKKYKCNPSELDRKA